MKAVVLILFLALAVHVNCEYVLFHCCTFNSLISALRCYTCSMGENDLDRRCVDDPANVESGSAITNCDKNYCISIRQEFLVSKIGFCEIFCLNQ